MLISICGRFIQDNMCQIVETVDLNSVEDIAKYNNKFGVFFMIHRSKL